PLVGHIRAEAVEARGEDAPVKCGGQPSSIALETIGVEPAVERTLAGVDLPDVRAVVKQVAPIQHPSWLPFGGGAELEAPKEPARRSRLCPSAAPAKRHLVDAGCHHAMRPRVVGLAPGRRNVEFIAEEIGRPATKERVTEI